jgi:hypothetical protein
MTTLATRLREIRDKEGFDIQVFDNDGNPVDTGQNGFGKYDFDRRARSTMTVAEWRDSRFGETWPGHSCKVLYGDGTEAHGNALLRTVRESYEDHSLT